jgi:hypothetical protein
MDDIRAKLLQDQATIGDRRETRQLDHLKVSQRTLLIVCSSHLHTRMRKLSFCLELWKILGRNERAIWRNRQTPISATRHNTRREATLVDPAKVHQMDGPDYRLLDRPALCVLLQLSLRLPFILYDISSLLLRLFCA